MFLSPNTYFWVANGLTCTYLWQEKSLIYTQTHFVLFFIQKLLVLYSSHVYANTILLSLFLFWPVGILMLLPYNLVELHFVLFQLWFWNKTQTFISWCLIHGWKLGSCGGAHICYYRKTGSSLRSQSHVSQGRNRAHRIPCCSSTSARVTKTNCMRNSALEASCTRKAKLGGLGITFGRLREYSSPACYLPAISYTKPLILTLTPSLPLRQVWDPMLKGR